MRNNSTVRAFDLNQQLTKIVKLNQKLSKIDDSFHPYLATSTAETSLPWQYRLAKRNSPLAESQHTRLRSRPPDTSRPSFTTNLEVGGVGELVIC